MARSQKAAPDPVPRDLPVVCELQPCGTHGHRQDRVTGGIIHLRQHGLELCLKHTRQHAVAV